MTLMDDHRKFASDNDFQSHVQSVVDVFLDQLVIYPPLEVELFFYPTKKEYGKETKRMIAGPVYSEKSGDAFSIHICRERLFDVSAIALQGWLEHEMALCIQQLQPEFYTCNFKRKIFPLMPVSGSAEVFILELTTRIEQGLKGLLATQMLSEMCRGTAQAHFLYAKMNSNPVDREKYEQAVSHFWIRAMHLCGKLRDFMPVFLLSKLKVEFSEDLELLWWRIHDYFSAEDRGFLKILADIPMDNKDSGFADNVIEMFKLVQIEYLEKQKETAIPSVFH